MIGYVFQMYPENWMWIESNTNKYSRVFVNIYDMTKVFSWICYLMQMTLDGYWKKFKACEW